MSQASAKTPGSIDKVVGANIRRLRQEKGLTQAGLGRAIGVSHQALYKYEAGDTRIAVAVIIGVCQALGCTPLDLFRGSASNVPGIDPDAAGTIAAHAVIVAERLTALPDRDQRFALFMLDNVVAHLSSNPGAPRQ